MKTESQFLSADYVHVLLDYNPENGEFHWKVKRGRLVKGSVAGSVDAKGYITIRVNHVLCYAHRLAWLIVYGAWPKNQIDHVDGDKANNRIANLREATNSQNQANRGIDCRNSSGKKGVSWSKEKRMWEARIRVKNKQKFLGYFSNLNDASNAYISAKVLYFGEFARVD